MNRVMVLGVLVGAWCANAAAVREFIDPETQARVFDASGDQVEFDAPSAPREFENFDAYLKWLVLRFEATPVYDERGELVDVRGAWILHGRPVYKFEGVEIVVRDPIVQTISGPFGFVVIGGAKYEMPIDRAMPALDDIEPAQFLSGLVTYRRSCGPTSPLGGTTGFCVVIANFKHMYIGYQSIGGTVDIAGAALVRPSTVVNLTVRFQNSSGVPLRISTPTTTLGVATRSASAVGGIGIAEWGVFGNPFIDPTKILRVDGSASGPVTPGGAGGASATFSLRLP